MFAGARILVAPLDWGLGHAARCVPLIHTLLEHGAVPVIGADKGPLALLREEFPALEHLRIPGLEVRYGSGRSQAWAMARQLPALLHQVRQEYLFFNRLRRELHVDAVVSDQRFGIRAADLPSVLLTHQVFPFSPFAQGIARRMNRRYIARFDRCWIPDHATSPGLAGALAHGRPLPGHAHYIGPLSRFRTSVPERNKPTYRVVAVISGPEPHRTLFERAVLAQLEQIDGAHLVLSGQVDGRTGRLPQLPTEALHAALLSAELIVGRTGYSTLMDMEAIGRGALLVPTPGQPEQEYLGRVSAQRAFHTVQQQHQLDIAAALAKPPGRSPVPQANDGILPAVTDLARMIADKRNTNPPAA